MINPAYTLRPPTEDDMESLVEFLNDCDQADTGLRSITQEDIKRRWNSLGFDSDHSVRLIENEEGKINGCASFWDLEKPPVNPWFDFRIHPDFTDKEAGNLLLKWGEQRALTCLDKTPIDLRVVLTTGTPNTHTAAKTLFEENKFIASRHFLEMKIDLKKSLQKPIWPQEIQLLHYNSKEEILANLENIVFTFDQSFQDHFGHVNRPLDQIMKEWRHHLENPSKRFDPTLWFMAMAGDEIVAICLCTKEDRGNPQQGHVNILGVKRPYRRKGLGLALLLHSFQEYARRGKTAVTLGVDASSITNATKLYEKAGMHVHRQFDVYEKEIRSGKDIRRQA